MTLDQIAAAREAARIITNPDACGTDEAKLAARSLLWLTDPTPLTWDVVCQYEVGFADQDYRGREILSNGSMCCLRDGSDDRLVWYTRSYPANNHIANPQPRTLGDLRQLMIRAGGETR